MKVLHLVSSPTLTGPADPAFGLADAQRRYFGIDAELASDSMRPGNLLDKQRTAGIPVVNGLHLCTKGSVLAAFSDRKRLRTLAEEYDFIHAHYSHDHALAAMGRGPARLVRTFHHPRSLVRRGLQGFAYRRTDGFILIAEAHQKQLLASYPDIDPSRTTVIEGAVDTDRFHPGVDGSSFRQKHRISDDTFVIGMVSRIKAGRRHENLVSAFARAKNMSPRPLHLVFIGSGEGMEDLAKTLDDHRVASSTSLYGFRDADLPEAIKSCDVTVLLSEGNDAGCRAILESLSVGVPVIGARHPAIVSVLENAGCGLLIGADDVDGLVQAILEVSSLEKETRQNWAKNARERVLSRYSQRQRAASVLAFYEKLMEKEPVR